MCKCNAQTGIYIYFGELLHMRIIDLLTSERGITRDAII